MIGLSRPIIGNSNKMQKKFQALFLDRDGVINRRLPAAYVQKWEEFEFLPGVLEAISGFSSLFRYIFIVTNQQGIGKGLMSEQALEDIHHHMRSDIEAAGGRTDGIYYCPHHKSLNCICRKPAPGMALQAKEQFPALDLSRSIMVGDSLSDMEFGKSLGMYTVLIQGKGEEIDPELFDESYESLFDFYRKKVEE
jgi:D-glycero-D-manno-heptose 1,7-bisphosphate phosphatase